jgi:hypothetical protein
MEYKSDFLAYILFANKFFLIMLVRRGNIRKEVMFMARRVVRLVCISLMIFWVLSKVMAFAPLLAIPLVGATVLYILKESEEIKNENKAKKRSSGHKKVTKS